MEKYYEEGKQPNGYIKYTLSDSETLHRSTYINNDIITCHAIWNPISFTVSYDSKGGTGAMSSDIVKYGSDFITKQNTFTKPGQFSWSIGSKI